ncbi:hypothetical protein EJB05_43026 [Eragrostis curvula]|uniref:Uncharacterized protein n=1 Tax=Eragrostis curvula TaxID=38414 RepID=A0A5J9TDT2_9POAL|nr:hypothetical protein EJB05_43026 [Eragrostis curvula]
MDDVAGERRRKGDAFPPYSALTPSSFPSGSSPLPAAAAIVLALPASRASAAGSPLPSTLLAGAMDGGGSGEALLVRRSKGKKRPPPAAPRADGREFGGGDRFRALWRDYHDLLQETDAKKKMRDRMNRRKLSLLAEIKFLRRKYKFFVKSNSQNMHYKLKGQARQIQSLVGINEASTFVEHGVEHEVPSTSKSTKFDLNQDSAMKDEEFDSRGHQGHSELGNFDQDEVTEDMMTIDAKFSVCRNTGNSPSSDDKRTISWQDRLTLQA